MFTCCHGDCNGAYAIAFHHMVGSLAWVKGAGGKHCAVQYFESIVVVNNGGSTWCMYFLNSYLI
jgi:hypothetical protein